jgi:GT2 family glycosyltransferase
MKKIVMIPTEKEGPQDMIILEQVLKSISPQVDTILLEKNHKVNRKFGLAYSKIIPSNVVELFYEKDKRYEKASVNNVGFQYIEDNYDEPVFLMTLGDDCIPEKNYVSKMFNGAEEKTIYSPFISWIDYDYDLVQYIHVAGLRYPKHGSIDIIPSLDYVMDNFNRLGSTLIINGVSGYIWDPKCGLREDPKYDGHWGYEDTDFKMQKIAAGYKIVPRPDIRFWHIQTKHKEGNRDSSAHNTPNRKYFEDKWTNYKSKKLVH